jgi:hypothetical protein
MRLFPSFSSDFMVLRASCLWVLDGKTSILYARAIMLLGWLLVFWLLLLSSLCVSLACSCSSFHFVLSLVPLLLIRLLEWMVF